jgi:hypothetical protein
MTYLINFVTVTSFALCVILLQLGSEEVYKSAELRLGSAWLVFAVWI